jgi:hypothetical protein
MTGVHHQVVMPSGAPPGDENRPSGPQGRFSQQRTKKITGELSVPLVVNPGFQAAGRLER